ncbi:DoxX family protein [Nocardiopsis coralliicola]
MATITPRTRAALADTTHLLARFAAGTVFLAHGWQKVSEMGLDGTAAMMAGMGVPAPQVAAAASIGIEIGGGLLLVLGLFLPLAGVLLAGMMAGAIAFAHLGAGLIGEGGMELPLVLGAAALALGLNASRFTLDHVFFSGRGGASAPAGGSAAQEGEDAAAGTGAATR